MPDPQLINNLIDLGVAGILITLMITGQLIPKPFYEREVKRGDTATEATAKTTEAVRDTALALKTVTEEVKGLRDELKSVKEELLRSRR